jgi:photosystem II stability/assembly factor-like uncharacterized protein
MSLHRLCSVFLPLLSLLFVVDASRGEDTPPGGPEVFKRLAFRNIGPAAGGRVCRAAGVPGDPLTWYAASAAGGIWKSVDGGLSWKPISDDMTTSTIGCLAIAPSDPNVIYAGSGEANIRGNVEVGNGIYRSTDAGRTWKHVWKQEGQIGTIIIHPTNPDIVFAAVLGRAFGPNPERGVYRTLDGGRTWKQVLARNADTGASDVRFDPNNPRILFAGLWQVRRRPWEMTSGGPGSGLFTSLDSGDTWTELLPPPADDSPDRDKKAAEGTRRCPGLPKGPWGKIGLAIAPSDSQRIYALIEAEEGGLFRSRDGGKTWELANGHRALRQRAWYYSTLTVDPIRPDTVWFPQVPLLKTTDGGKTLQRVRGPHHGDHHDIWIDPKNPNRIIDSNDGGVDISTDGGASWYAPPLPIAQVYHVAVDSSTPYRVAGTLQDIGTACGPSNSLTPTGITLAPWHPVGGGEAGHVSFHPTDPHVVYAGEYGGYISRYDERTRQARNLGIYPYNASGHAPSDLKYRFQWTAPILASRHEPGTVYHGANVLFVTRDDGRSWTALGDDLTRNDRSKQKWSGGPITGDNTGVEVYGTIFALAESPVQKELLWTGSDDGLVHVSRDGGKSWTNVTPAIKGLPEWGTITCIEASPFDAGSAYVVVDAHRLDDRKPYLFRTTNFGKTWSNLSDNVKVDGYLNVVREDPKKQGQLYAGWEHGLVYSSDGGTHWEPLKLNLPPVRVTDLVVKDDDLVVATNGRSLWIFDDLTPLRTVPLQGPDHPVQLLPGSQAVRYRLGEVLEGRLRVGWRAANPPQGAALHYWLARRPKGDLEIRIKNDKGVVIRTLSSKKEPPEPPDEGAYSVEEPPKPLPVEPGLHRVVWDLRHEGAKKIQGARVDTGNPRIGPLVTPGTWTVELTVEGKTVSTTVEVLPDPRTESSFARRTRPRAVRGGGAAAKEETLRDELARQEALALKVRDDITHVTRIVESLRSVRKQIQARTELLKDDERAKPLLKASEALLPRLDELEGRLHNPKAKVNYDILAQKGGAQLYSQLAWLLVLLEEADGEAGQGVQEVYAEQHKLLEKYATEWQGLVEKEIEALERQAVELKFPGLIVPASKGSGKAAAR